jgi:hypothetical protein
MSDSITIVGDACEQFVEDWIEERCCAICTAGRCTSMAGCETSTL